MQTVPGDRGPESKAFGIECDVRRMKLSVAMFQTVDVEE